MNYLNIALKIFIINEYAKLDEFFNRRLQDLADGVGLYQEAVMAVDSISCPQEGKARLRTCTPM